MDPLHPLCQLCGKRPATTHLTELEPDTDRRELHLCSACVQSLGVQLESGPPPISSLVAKATSESGAETETSESESEGESTESDDDEGCPNCGLKFSEYASNNLFGCANCFLFFGDRVEALLKRYHGATRHVGRAPQKADTAVTAVAPQRRGGERRKLEAALKEAVAKERYEEAAALRDQIRKLEQARSEAKSVKAEPDPDQEDEADEEAE